MGEVELDAVAVGLDPEGVAAAGEEPGDGGVVALGDAADLEHVGRAVGTGVATVGAEPDAPPGLVELFAVAGAEAGEALAGAGVPVGAGAEEGGARRELEDDAIVVELDAEGAELAAEGERTWRARFASPPAAAFARLADPSQPARPLQLLGRDHSLRQLDELVARFAGRRPQAEPADQPAAAAPDLERERVEPHDGLQRAVLEDDRLGHSALLSRLGLPAVAIR